MSGVNKATILGRLGQDPEVRTTQQGTKIVTLSVATSEQWKDRSSGEKKEKTEWHRVVIFGAQDSDGLAGVAEKYLRKGHQVYLCGKLQTRKWTDQQGVERYTTEIVLQGFGAELQLLENGGTGGSRPPPADSPDDYGRQSSRSGARPASGAPAAFQSGGIDDDIPF